MSNLHNVLSITHFACSGLACYVNPAVVILNHDENPPRVAHTINHFQTNHGLLKLWTQPLLFYNVYTCNLHKD